MSGPDLSDYTNQAARIDPRFEAVAKMIPIESELRDSASLKALLSAVRADGEEAMKELAEVSPTNLDAVSSLLVKIRTLVYMRRVLDNILCQGAAAESSIRADDHRERDE